jgi:hypothetical protein
MFSCQVPSVYYICLSDLSHNHSFTFTSQVQNEKAVLHVAVQEGLRRRDLLLDGECVSSVCMYVYTPVKLFCLHNKCMFLYLPGHYFLRLCG